MQAGVPELSLSDHTCGDPGRRESFSTALLRGLQDYGFITLRDHPVPFALLDQAYALSGRLFAQDEAVKRRYPRGPRGYTPFRTEHAKDRKEPDLKEFWQLGAERKNAKELVNVWPQSPPGFRDTFLALFDALQETGRIILDALAPALGLPRDFFESRMRERNSVLRLLHYPPVAADVDAGSARAAAHEDINLITLLPAPDGAGLELLDRDGEWVTVQTARHNLIIDSGDMLARMTNDLIPATTHRVVNPSVDNVSRYSLPFFMHPDSDVILSCLPSCIGAGAKYPDIRAGTFLEQRLRDIGLVNDAAIDSPGKS